jgi:hypothetical protein
MQKDKPGKMNPAEFYMEAEGQVRETKLQQTEYF